MSQVIDTELEEQFAQKRMSAGTFRRLLAYVRPYRRTLYLNLAFTLLATLSALAGPQILQRGIDRYLTRVVDADAALRGILWISGLYLANLLAGWGLSVIQVRSAIAVGQGAMNDLRVAVFEHIQRLSLSFFDRTQQGRIIARADSDIDSLDRILTWGANQLLASGLTLVGAVALMLYYDWRLCLAVSVVLPPLALSTHIFQRRAMQAYRRLREQGSRLTAAAAEGIAGVRVVQAFAREDVNLLRYQELGAEYGRRMLSAARLFHTYLPFVGFLSGLGTAIILGVGGTLAVRGQLTVGELAAFILYLGMFFGPIQTMGDLYNALLSTAASAERIFALLDTVPQVQDRPGAQDLGPIRGHIQFDRVWFRYETTPPEAWILRDIQLEVRPGETIALVGATGSGKSSIVSLLMRFYEPQRGRVLLDGLNVGDATLTSLHRQIAIVTQDNFLFTGTVMENLRFARMDATDDEIIADARTLGTHDVIERLKQGYATPVGERGNSLSAGERQLICITRAMVARPRVLILDEATSAVDPQTEARIQNALERLFERRTSVVIAHRLSTVRHATRIVVLDQGAMIEQGTHDELVLSGGRYAQLYREFVRE
ncbi:MAG: ABC transporter ATP-binding protein [Verrucomicrobiales bacterium]|nr:ABC transporter ATP-binding protein [Verrucomicrobiales bacterium]